ncbi:uncharacterized protein LOC133842922 [Drosophila sulfurigaster albostrigata]|uniref:uncharacterized protein LOC133842922 n=1 Tax=Drosophila sulfurigaster albostrigata TaxID=89887 RepID=UPI002D21D551|nr:uncharacterized protein LOC133842922 [Drosophila sulfurigaster albostrigata]
MAEDSCNIKMWAGLIARINACYSIIYLGIEIINASDHYIGVGMLAIWFGLYSFNILINLFFAGRSSKWEKFDVVFWFCSTLILLIIRLVCTDYRNLSIGFLVFAIFVNIYMVFSLIIISLLGYQVDNPNADIRSCLSCDQVNNRIISVATDAAEETNDEGLSHNLRSTIDSYRTDLSSSNLNNDSRIAFGTAPTFNDINNDSQNDNATAPDFSDLNNDSQIMARSADANVNDPPPSYDYVMTHGKKKF